MSSFEVIPYFTLADYQNAQIAPFLWVRPVDTTLTVQSQTDTQLLTNGLSLPLYNNMTIYTHFNVTDSSSLLNGLNLTSAQVTLQILQDNAAQSVFETISFTELGDGNYEVIIPAITIGTYTAQITASLLNYAINVQQFRFVVTTRTTVINLSTTNVDNAVSVIQNGQITITVSLTDQITGGSIKQCYNFL